MATTQPTLEISRIIDERPLSALQLAVIALCSVNVFIDGYDIQVMALAVPSLAQAWGLQSAQFSLALSAALIGGALGGAFLAPLGDRVGRKPLLIWTTVLMGGASFMAATATTLTELVIWRILMGLGTGASIANAVALTSEYVPARRRAKLITLMYSNIALGALTAGVIAPNLIAAYGWPSLFVLGGLLPVGLTISLALWLPESVRFLMEKKPDDPRIPSILRRLVPGVDPASVRADARASGALSVWSLFESSYRTRTALIWTLFFLNMFVLYMLISWLPALLADHGWERAQALRGSVLIQAGGIAGGFLLAYFVDRSRTVPSMVVAYLVTTVAFGLFTVVPSTMLQWGLLLLIVGAGTSGTQFAANALVATFYPPAIRATGVGWANAIGRFGAIFSPLAGGWVVARDLEAFVVLALLAVPVMLSAGCILLLPLVVRQPKTAAA